MNYRKLTKILFIAFIIIASLYDVFVLIKGGTQASISHVAISWASQYPIFTSCFGILCGHFFFRSKKKSFLIKLGYEFPVSPLAFGLFAGYFSFFLAVHYNFIIGVLAGHLFWRVKDGEIFTDLGI